MNPIDVIRTRYYNQPYVNGRGTIYNSGIDVIKKILCNEGPMAFYKGLVTHFLRIGPHFCRKFLFDYSNNESHFYFWEPFEGI